VTFRGGRGAKRRELQRRERHTCLVHTPECGTGSSKRQTAPITLHTGPCAQGAIDVPMRSSTLHARSTRMAPTMQPCGKVISSGMLGQNSFSIRACSR
jgi:hypothetical protein